MLETRCSIMYTIKKPIVSVIIPTYNAAEYVRDAIGSALSSTRIPLEVIAVDDGSTDGTLQILESYGDSIRRFRQPNGGPYRARNLGAKYARGSWLAFLDADDKWERDKLEKQIECAEIDTAMVYSDCRNIGDTSHVKPLQSDSTAMFEGRIFTHLLMDNFISLSSVMIRKSWFDRLNGFSLNARGVQDWDMWLRVTGAGGNVKLCREPLTLYRHHAGQMSTSVEDRLHDRLSVLERALQQPAAQQVSRREIRKAFASVFAVSAARVAQVSPWCGLRLYLQAATYWPFNQYRLRQTVKCALGSLRWVRV